MGWIRELSEINGGAGNQTQDLLDSEADSLNVYTMYCHTILTHTAYIDI